MRIVVVTGTEIVKSILCSCDGVFCCFHWEKANFRETKVEKVPRLKFLFLGLDLPTAKCLRTLLGSRFYQNFPVAQRNVSKFLIKIKFREAGNLKHLYRMN